jgi:hypothetical protein
MKLERTDPSPTGSIAFFSGTCPHCHRESTFMEKGRHFRGLGQSDTLGDIPATSFLASCAGCTRSVLIDSSGKREMPLRVEPRAARSFPDPDYTRDVPESIQRILAEAYAASSREAWTLVGLGCRVAMERMAALHGVTEGMLGKKLAVMREKFPGLAGPLENAEVVKLIGNAAAHDTEYDLGAAEAAAALEFVEEVLRDVYILPARRKRVVDALPKKGTK